MTGDRLEVLNSTAVSSFPLYAPCDSGFDRLLLQLPADHNCLLTRPMFRGCINPWIVPQWATENMQN